jgi:UTP--glucose-1-phosphate uridylyltransferase
MFIGQGKEFAFVSNSDNLGATVDFNILDFLLNPPAAASTQASNTIRQKSPEFLMEITNKTRADINKAYNEINVFKIILDELQIEF